MDKKEYTPEEVKEFLEKLFKETGYIIQVHPEFIHRDDNTFSIITVMTLEKIKEK